MPSDVEQRFAGLARGMMRARVSLEKRHPLAHRHRALVAVILQVREFRRLAVPGRHQLHQQTDGGRGQHGVRPHHLRPATGSSILLDLALKAFIGNEAAAAQAEVPGRRQDDLAAVGDSPLPTSCTSMPKSMYGIR
jgi:hypothetical protein